MTGLTQERKEELFNSVVPLINEVAKKSFNAHHCAEAGVQYEDIQSEAYLIAWGSLDMWDESKAKWTTYVYNRVFFKLNHWHRKRCALNGGQNYQKYLHADLELSADFFPNSDDEVGAGLEFTPDELAVINWVSNSTARSWESSKRFLKKMANELDMCVEQVEELVDELSARLGDVA